MKPNYFIFIGYLKRILEWRSRECHEPHLDLLLAVKQCIVATDKLWHFITGKTVLYEDRLYLQSHSWDIGKDTH